MALDKEYFDSIHIDVVKKKYYNANKVEAVFSDIRRQAEELVEENRQMKLRLDMVDGEKLRIGESVLSAQAIYREIVDRANAKAEEILAEARKEREEMLSEALQQQEYAVQRVEQCYANMKQQHMTCIEAINAEWQSFLCGLYPEEASDIPSAPEDLHDKVGAIARELAEIGEK